MPSVKMEKTISLNAIIVVIAMVVSVSGAFTALKYDSAMNNMRAMHAEDLLNTKADMTTQILQGLIDRVEEVETDLEEHKEEPSHGG